MVKPDRINIYQYTEYREFIKDYRTQQKLTWEAFSELCDFKATHHLYHICITPKRSLIATHLWQVSRALDLWGDETAYFYYMVRFGNATNHGEINFLLTRMDDLREGK